MSFRPVTKTALVIASLVLLMLVLASCTSSSTTTTPMASSTTRAPTTTIAESSTTAPAAPSTSVDSTSTSVVPSGTLTGAGGPFPSNIYAEWGLAFEERYPRAFVDYQSIGMATGLTQFAQQTVDFGATDLPLTNEEVAAVEEASGATVLHVPTVLGAIAIPYNLPGVSGLALDAETLAAIFLGDLTRWDDPRIAALNPDVTLPSIDVVVVHRSDPALTTVVFTSYLSLVSTEWKSKVGSGTTVDWPVGLGSIQGSGVSPLADISFTPGAIGYVELGMALGNSFPVAGLENRSGNFIALSLDSAAEAAKGVEFPPDLRFSLLDSANPQAYPIVYPTWILAYDKMKDPAKANLLKSFLTFALGAEGDDLARDLLYVPLPAELKDAARNKINQISS